MIRTHIFKQIILIIVITTGCKVIVLAQHSSFTLKNNVYLNADNSFNQSIFSLSKGDITTEVRFDSLHRCTSYSSSDSLSNLYVQLFYDSIGVWAFIKSSKLEQDTMFHEVFLNDKLYVKGYSYDNKRVGKWLQYDQVTGKENGWVLFSIKEKHSQKEDCPNSFKCSFIIKAQGENDMILSNEW